MTDIEQHDRVQVFVGVDVGKGAHHAVALDRKGKRLLDSALPNDETKLRALIGKLKEHGQVLLVVDQPATVGALPVAVARDEGVLVAYLPGLAMRRIADLHAGEAKTDARDAYIIARGCPQSTAYASLAEAGRQSTRRAHHAVRLDEDLAGQITQVSNRIPRSSDTDPSRTRARRGLASGSPCHARSARALSLARAAGRAEPKTTGEPARQTRASHGKNMGRRNPSGAL